MAAGDLKVDLINGAYSKLRISGITAQPTPEDLELALTELEEMAQEFRGRNICTGYNFEDEPDPNSPHNLPQEFKHAYKMNLAGRLLSDFGKGFDPDPMLISQQQATYSFLSAITAPKRQTQYPSRMPRGNGASLKYNRWQKYYRPQAEAPQECATNKMIIGDINDFREHFDSYLGDIEDISSYTIEADTGLTIQSDSLETPDVLYRIKAVGFGTENRSNGFLQVKIIATTDTGRIETRVINFEINEAS